MSRRHRQTGKALQLGVIIVVSLLLVIAVSAFIIGPSFVAKRFNPVGNLIRPAISSSAQKLHQSLTVADLHADSLLWGRDLLQRSNIGHVDVPRLLQGNVALQTFTVVTKVPRPLRLEGNGDRSDDIIKLAILQRWPIATWFSLAERAIYQANKLEAISHQVSSQLTLIKTKQDLNHYLDQRQRNPQLTAGILGLEGAHALEGKIENLDQLYNAGFRLIGLAHFFDTEVSGSAHGIDQGGLTPFGREVLQRIESLNLIVDLAHASLRTIDDVLQVIHRPVLVSHTGVQGTCNNTRNLSDRHLQQIAQTGGIIGIGFWKTAVCGEDVTAIVKAIRYVADRVGVEHVALGSDFDGAVRVPFDAANIGFVTEALQAAGFAKSEIEQIMGLNVIRLLQRVLPN
jgi:membrane dipeptidase